MSKDTQFIWEYKRKLQSHCQTIGVSTSTISREVKRNSTRNNKYVWNKA